MGGFGAHEIAEYNPDKFAALCSERPAIHRFPGSMAKRIQTLAQIVVDRYDGDAAGVWTAGDPDGEELLRRIKGLPGFGEVKAQIFLALLGKQYGVTPKGWRAAAGQFGKDEDELVELTQAHLASVHPGLEYDRDAILFMAY
jgi:uncharacterized HhH-GPD family protein